MQVLAAIWLKPNESCGDRKELIEFRNAFAVIKTIGNHSQGEGLNFRESLFTGLPICHDPRQVGYLGNPATIIFTLKFNPHDFILLMQVYLQAKP
ncbi:MAG: hypothetical protein HXY45_21730 [Syntrophaceae bacterium]|nr:hypothetical protein [Syntrophaceae bacterium]